MNRVVGIVVLIILIAGGWYIYSNRPLQEFAGPLLGPSEQEIDPLVIYFGRQLTAPPTPDGPIPIEGYDANLLLGRYGGLLEEDFDGVRAMQGTYIIENNALIFSFEAEAEHSAARTLTPVGYGTLLNNLIDRLGITIDSEESVDALVIRLQNDP